jgi:RNA polymerase sigma factor (sigma-70 family)
MLLSLSLLRRSAFTLAAGATPAVTDTSARVERIVRDHVDAIWRTARDLGVAQRDLDDVVQEVMLVVLRRCNDIELECERAFVLGTTVRVAANWRRGRRRRPEDPTESIEGVSGVYELPPGRAGLRGPEQAFERSEKLALLGLALEQMPEPLRVAFTLFELEQLTAREIAEQLGVARTVVFSRVRRAWVIFRRCCERAHVEVRPGAAEASDD